MVPRKPGQYARERFSYLSRMVVLLLGGALAIGLIVALVVRPDRLLIYVLTLPAVGAFYLGTFQRKEAKEILGTLNAWRKGAIGEEQTGALLQSLEGEGFRILNDVDTGFGNLDHVVVGPTGVFLIETKAHQGPIWLANGGRLMIGNYEKESWVSQAQRGALEVKDCLRRVGIETWVEALIVLTNIRLERPITKPRVTVIDSDRLIASIKGRRGKHLNAMQITRAVAAIYRGKQSVKVGA